MYIKKLSFLNWFKGIDFTESKRMPVKSVNEKYHAFLTQLHQEFGRIFARTLPDKKSFCGTQKSKIPRRRH